MNDFLPLSTTRAQVQGPLYTSVILPRKFFGLVDQGEIPRQEGFNLGTLWLNKISVPATLGGARAEVRPALPAKPLCPCSSHSLVEFKKPSM